MFIVSVLVLVAMAYVSTNTDSTFVNLEAKKKSWQ